MKKSLIVIMCVVFFTLAGFTGCKSNKIADNETTLEIKAYSGGYGTNAVVEIAKRFETIKGGNVDVVVSIDYTNYDAPALIKSGPAANSVDLFMMGHNVYSVLYKGEQFLPGYKTGYMDISDVYNSYPYGEEGKVMIKDKINADYLNMATVEEKQYSLPWAGGMNGIVYNDTKFKQLGIAVPRTTQELFEVCDAIKGNTNDSVSNTALVYSSKTGYWDYVFPIWWAQYEGCKNFVGYSEGTLDGLTFSNQVMGQYGKLYSLQTLEKMLNPDNGYIDKGVNSMEYTEAQFKFLQGNGLMMPNGDWLENEMRNVSNKITDEFKFMQTPIVSELADKIGLTGTKEQKESLLREIIDYIDGGETAAKPNCAPEQIKEVKDARNVVSSIGSQHNFAIPVYSNASQLAKEFLRYFYSDEGLAIYENNTTGCSLPFTFTDASKKPASSTKSVFIQSREKILEHAINNFGYQKSKLVVNGGMTLYKSTNYILVEKVFSNLNAKDRKTAQEIWDGDKNYWTVERFNDLINRSNI